MLGQCHRLSCTAGFYATPQNELVSVLRLNRRSKNDWNLRVKRIPYPVQRALLQLDKCNPIHNPILPWVSPARVYVGYRYTCIVSLVLLQDCCGG